MFDVQPTELLLLGTVALLVIPPKDLPRAMRFAGQWIGKARGVARQFRAGFDEMIREAELADLKKQWAAENERIMREHPMPQLADLYAPAPALPSATEDGALVLTEQPAIHDAAAPVIAPEVPLPPAPMAALPAPETPEIAEAAPKPKRKPRAKASPAA